MIPHTQTIFVNDPRGIPGDCMRTAVAALLDLPTEAVPHFVLFDAPGAWFNAFTLWLSGRGLQISPRTRTNITELCLAIGTSPRDVEHIVVWGPDGLVHDPHPSHAGIEPRQFWAIIPIEARPDPRPQPRHDTDRDAFKALLCEEFGWDGPDATPESEALAGSITDAVFRAFDVSPMAGGHGPGSIHNHEVQRQRSTES